MTRRRGSSQLTPTPLPCRATKPQENAKAKLHKQTKNGRREKTVQNTPANSGFDRRESYHFPQINEGNWGQRKKGKRELCKKIETKQMRKRWGRRRKSERPREPNPKRSKKRARTRYVRNPARARGMDIAPHSVGAMSTPGGELPGKSPQENCEWKPRQNEYPPEESKFKTMKTRSNTRAQRWPERQLATSTPRDSSTLP